MLLSSLFITFLLEYFLTPAEDSFDKYLSRVINWVRFKLDVDDKKDSPCLHGWYWCWEVH